MNLQDKYEMIFRMIVSGELVIADFTKNPTALYSHEAMGNNEFESCCINGNSVQINLTGWKEN